MKQRAFTIVELLVVITIMGILLTLAVVNVRSTQVQARDSERSVDTENIATALESYYDTVQNSSLVSSYPGLLEIGTDGSSSAGKVLTQKTGNGSLYAPNVDTEGPWSIVHATNNNQTATGVTPAPTESTYVYQPLQADNTLCATSVGTGCVKFNIYYKKEQATDECPASQNNICIIRSRHQ